MKENCGSTSERLHKSPFSMSKTERSSIQRCCKHPSMSMAPCRGSWTNSQLGIRIHAGAPELPVEQVLAMFLNGTIVYGDPSCHHHCEGHHHE